MGDVLSKISSYNVLNFLLSGIVFGTLASDILQRPLVHRDALRDAFLYYFLGLVVSRVGSLIVEPILRSKASLKFADYEDFVKASRKDPKLEVLLEINNMYRTLVSAFSLLLLLALYVRIERALPFIRAWDSVLAAVLILVIFLFSYRKQTSYISRRVKTDI